jgi:anti-anti-sigma factor
MPIQHWSDGIWVAQLGNEPALSEDLSALKQEAEVLADVPDLVLDFAAVDQINSSNLSQLLRLRKLAVDRDSRLMLTNLADSLWAVFLTTGLDKIFHVAPTLPTALASLQMNEPS